MKRFVACGATAFALLLVSAPAKADGSRLEAFAGYYFTEETEDDISYGARYTWDSGRGWGLMGSYETLEVDGPGYNVPGGVDAEFQQIEASWVLYLGNRHFDLFAGVGATILDVDHGIAGATVDLSDTAVSTHAGVGYRFDLATSCTFVPRCACARTTSATRRSTSRPRSPSGSTSAGTDNGGG